MNGQSAVNFPGHHRIHIALAVTNLQRSRRFYETLLGVSPTKERPGYVKFEPQDPSVNLTLNQVEVAETKEPPAVQPPVTHYGIQVKSTQAVQDAMTRMADAGFGTFLEENTTCCFAVQDKFWVSDPDGNRWEVFVVLEADAEQHLDSTSTCCPTDSLQTPPACC